MRLGYSRDGLNICVRYGQRAGGLFSRFAHCRNHVIKVFLVCIGHAVIVMLQSVSYGFIRVKILGLISSPRLY